MFAISRLVVGKCVESSGLRKVLNWLNLLLFACLAAFYGWFSLPTPQKQKRFLGTAMSVVGNKSEAKAMLVRRARLDVGEL